MTWPLVLVAGLGLSLLLTRGVGREGERESEDKGSPETRLGMGESMRIQYMYEGRVKR